MTGRERVLAMIEGRKPPRLPLMPITMMLAADRIGACYRDYASDYRVLVEGQLRVAQDFGFDYVSAISDPAREAADFGAPVQWFDDDPPMLNEQESLLADKAVLKTLKAPDPFGGGRMHDRIKAVAALRERAGDELFVEGWVEGPCAEGADLRGINRLMLDFIDDPDIVEELFAVVVENGIRFAKAQVEAGADIIGVGDAAASLVGRKLYEQYVLPAEKRLVDGIHAAGGRVRLHICGNTRKIFQGMGSLSCEIVDLDWPAPLSEARAQMPETQVLLGNIDPVVVLRNGTPESVRAAIAECHRQAGARYIVSAGCEVVRDTPEANLRALCDYARETAPEAFEAAGA